MGKPKLRVRPRFGVDSVFMANSDDKGAALLLSNGIAKLLVQACFGLESVLMPNSDDRGAALLLSMPRPNNHEKEELELTRLPIGTYAVSVGMPIKWENGDGSRLDRGGSESLSMAPPLSMSSNAWCPRPK